MKDTDKDILYMIQSLAATVEILLAGLAKLTERVEALEKKQP